MADFSTMTRQERIKHKRNKLKLSPSYISKQIGVSRVTYTNWEDGRVLDISWSKFTKLAAVLITTPEWLEYGSSNENYIYNDSAGNITKSLEGVHVIKSTSIIVYEINDWISNKTPISIEYIDMPAKSGNVFALKVDKENKLSKANVGDALIIDEQAELSPGEEVYILFNDNNIMLCIYHQEKENQLFCLTESGKAIFETSNIKNIYPIVAIAKHCIIKKRTK